MSAALVCATIATVKNTMIFRAIIINNATKISSITPMSKMPWNPIKTLIGEAFDNLYLIAIKVAKFAHRKRSSHVLNPLFFAIWIFSFIV